MREFKMSVKRYTDPEEMAAAYLTAYFGNQKVEYPLNPFKMLKDEGIAFSFQNYHKLEGVYIPASAEDDIPVVGINAKRPVTRQRFTAAHELCHHFRDADKRIACPLDHKTGTEKFAESFAAAVLMPMAELRQQVKQRTEDRYIDFDAVLEIADYFGVSFESCLFRIAYNIHAIPGNTEWKNLKKRAKDYAPDKKRKDRHMSYAKLYADLFDCYSDALKYDPIDRAKYLFQSDYIYNDSRMEGLNITQEEAAEIVTDLRLNQQNSPYCTDDEKQEAFMSIAGHYRIYSEIFSEPLKDKCSVFETSGLNSRLFSYYPNPDYGGGFRQNNTMVLGAKFDTVDYNDIASERIGWTS